MVTSMIPNVNNVFKNPNIIDMRFLSAYNPLINYDWSTTTTSGLRYLKDVGSTPTYDASMYFGRGAYLNGVDQSITLTLNMSNINTIAVRLKREPNKNFRLFGQNTFLVAYVNFDITFTRIRFATGVEFDFLYAITAGAMVDVVITKEADTWCLYENGVLKSTKVFTGTSNNNIDRIGLAGSDYSQGTIKDLFVFSRGLTQSEKDSYTNTPELFYAMAQSDSTCVLNMPMCETDGYVRNMKSYSEGNELINPANFIPFNTNDTVEVNGTTITITLSTDYWGYCPIDVDTSNGSYVYYSYEVVSSTGGSRYVRFTASEAPNGAPIGQALPTAIGVHKGVIYVPSDIGNISFGNSPTNTLVIKDVSVKKLSGAYPITNYTTSVRDNAKNLQYGLQTCKFVRDGLGVIQSASDYLECDKVGYADTGWMPSVGKDWSIELICQSKGVTDFGVQSTGWLIVSQSQGNKYFIYTKNSFINTVNSYLYGSSVCLSLVYTEKLKTLTLYENSIYVNSITMDTSIYPLTINFLLGKRNGGGQLSEGILKLFKVHNKELTQAEITKNYNSYVAKGLLS